jgi:single-strand DNA-binding protein
MGLNKVMLLGNLGKDPEVRYTPQQMAICQFSLATGERKKDTNGQWVDHTEWHNIVVFGKTAENCARFLKKGRQAFIEGRIRTRKWQDKEGKDRYTTEIVANSVQFVGGKGSSSDAGAGDMGSSAPMSAVGNLSSADSLASNAGDVSFDDDDIPF